MTISARARNAYHQSTRSTASPREVERQLLSKLTTALAVAEKNRDHDYPAFVQALSKNLEFWTVVASDVAGEGNQLPTGLRAQLFYLFEFTRFHTNKIIAGDENLNAAPLIEINQNIIKGLQGAQAQS